MFFSHNTFKLFIVLRLITDTGNPLIKRVLDILSKEIEKFLNFLIAKEVAKLISF